MADPALVKNIVRAASDIVSVDRITVHLHDTRAMAEANLVAALDAGVRRFDASILGLGGCPFIPGAAGNIATEKAVQILKQQGFRTETDCLKLERVAAYIRNVMAGSQTIT